MSFWGELKRRNVFKVGAAYLIAAWLILQVASIIFPALSFPGWALPLVTVFLIIGFIVAIILAWAYEVTPDGVKLTKKVPLADSITHVTGRKLDYILGALLVIAVGYIVIDKVFLGRSPVETEVASTIAERVAAATDVEETPKTIAVLPFADLSPERNQEYFVDGLSEEILNSLAQIPDLLVTGRTSSFSFKGSNKKTPEIANELGVENILEGSVRKAGNNLRITAQLLRGKDGFHLWSKTYDKEFKVEDMFSVQEDIAAAVANELKVTLGIDHPFRQIGGTENEKAYELYLFAQGQWNQSSYDGFIRAKEYINSSIGLDPEFALAWATKSIIYNFLSVIDQDNDRVASELETGLVAAERAIELEPDLSAGYASLGQNRSFRGDWIEAELAYRKLFELTTESITPMLLAVNTHYFSVGYLGKAKKLFEDRVRNDPFDNPNRAWYIMCLGSIGDTDAAEKEYKRSKALFGDNWDWGDLRISIVRFSTVDVVSRDDIIYSDPIFDMAKEHIDSPKEALAELRRIYTEDDNVSIEELLYISMWAAYFGNTEFAIDAIKKVNSLSAVGAAYTLYVWSPVYHDTRRTPQFKEFVREIGLVNYWEKFGWPDLCHPTDDGDFVCN